ncbi:MAG: NAD(P)/FAD-dependent oxidoreductase [Anaeromicrobium sp.]|jgi:pyruvate/2-oxoglutarate dehydrogenase complex dihydrolipoamide dehydrogenase (E3) component|uniref:dihydrolipoyl dehydrogenase family protein n=1 Tax=Anaeromicrobium sp. TaxID=1929132 RepID=UPI0025D7093D|nr:NAD(P)/FAD-dependent oxidoreductase [Anaeromicrobium sp.]MCT4592927.1 NAD(P)/FAD-dependent oxidoreductase [Anaeromicrobium sp.]
MKKYDYDLIIIGAGGAGITASFTGNGFKRKVLLIEKNKIGGECTHSGCVPSKSLIKAAKLAHNVTKLKDYSIDLKYKMNSENVMDYVKNIINKVYEEEKPHVFEEKGISFLEGHASFKDSNTISVNGENIRAKNFIIATGTSPKLPAIKGIDSDYILTNESLFQLDKLPKSIGVIGAGAIGIELAQALNRLGVSIHIFLRGDRILKKEERKISETIEHILLGEGIKIHKNVKFNKIEKGTIHYLDNSNVGYFSSFEKILVATGRKPNLENMNLKKIGVDYDSNKIIVNSKLQTSVPHIYAAGDIVGPYRFSHMAEYQGFIAAFNCVFPVKKKADYSQVLWTTFTDPEISHMGYTEEESRKKYDNIKVYTETYSHLDRAITDNEKGFVKIICHKDNIVGAHIIGNRAGELIHEIQMLKKFNIPIRKTTDMIYAYPTYSDIIRKIGKKAYLDYLNNNLIVKTIKNISK